MALDLSASPAPNRHFVELEFLGEESTVQLLLTPEEAKELIDLTKQALANLNRKPLERRKTK